MVQIADLVRMVSLLSAPTLFLNTIANTFHFDLYGYFKQLRDCKPYSGKTRPLQWDEYELPSAA